MNTRLLLFLLSLMGLFSCSKTPLETVTELDLEKYQGTWYEIARLPNSFEKNLSCVSATYSVKENGKIKVLNKGYNSKTAKLKTITGTATVPNSNYPGRLSVSFFWPFAGDYYVMALAQDYGYALVGSPSREYLWILARNKTLDEKIIDELSQKAKEKGFPVEKIQRIDQTCD